jgi:hypothetical protein
LDAHGGGIVRRADRVRLEPGASAESARAVCRVGGVSAVAGRAVRGCEQHWRGLICAVSGRELRRRRLTTL